MARTVGEWVATHDDQAVPPRVRLRIFDRHHGICHISKRKIQAGEAWQLDHIVALINGGKHCESNLAPALVQPHREKTKSDVKLKAKVDRIRKKHLGIKKAGRTIPGRRFNGEPIPSRARQ